MTVKVVMCQIASFVQNEDLVLVALETLRGVATIFSNDQTSVTWDREKLGLFKSIISRQVRKLQECVSRRFPGLRSLVLTLQSKCFRICTTAGKEVQTAMEKPADSSTATLRSFFEKLEERLKEKEFSSCAWEIVRTELQGGLEKLQTFLESRN
ncbi:interferon alpha-2-like [Ictalurus furcatus]|uniref:interferon alpha-2-like n=1 Tax=Ictalurus furcatus TaxID=66913 RepID=UPI0023504212|nr:interferon alpha-2-like [Ictalurus furcatus]